MKMSSGFDSSLLGLGITLNPKKGRKVKAKHQLVPKTFEITQTREFFIMN